jgi:hypothetical protein
MPSEPPGNTVEGMPLGNMLSSGRLYPRGLPDADASGPRDGLGLKEEERGGRLFVGRGWRCWRAALRP